MGTLTRRGLVRLAAGAGVGVALGGAEGLVWRGSTRARRSAG